MCNLISSELFKIWKGKVTYVVGILFVVIALLQAVVYGSFAASANMEVEITGILGILTPLEGDFSYIIISIFITIIVCQDFSTGSIRQIIGKGSRRANYVFAKYIAMILVVAVFMLAASIIDFIAFSMIGEVGEFSSEVIVQLVIFALGAFSMILGYTAITEFICIVFKKNTITIPLNLLFIFAGGIVAQLTYYLTENEKFYRYWLPNMSASFGDFDIAIEEKIIYIAVFLGLAVVFSSLSAIIFTKRDIE